MVRYGRKSLAEGEESGAAEAGPAGAGPSDEELPVLTY
jgi:hypothetical protein